MGTIAPRAKPEYFGPGDCYTAVPFGTGKDAYREIRSKKGHAFAVIPEAEWSVDSERIKQDLSDGKGYTPRRRYQGAWMGPEEMREVRKTVFEDGTDCTLEVSAWTRYLGRDEIDQGGKFAQEMDRFASEQWPAFMREIFARLYNMDRNPVDPENQPAGVDWMIAIFEKAEALPEWQDLLHSSEGDPWACGLSTISVNTALAKAIGEQLNQLPEEDPQRLKEQADTLQELAPDSEQAKQAQEAAEKAQQAAQSVAEAIRDDATGAISRAIAGAAQGASAEIAETQSAMSGLGAGSGTGPLSALGTTEEIRKALAENPQLRRIAQIAGRLRLHAKRKQRTKVKYIPEQIVDITLGDELENLIDSELLQLAMPETELLLAASLAERQALQYEMEGTESADRGPVIMAIDCSGSMNGSRFEWGIGVAIALAEISMKQNRPFVFFHFDDEPHEPHFIRKPKELTIEKLLEWIQFYSGWGTSLSRAVDKAAEIQREGEWKKADLVLISDGDDYNYTKSLQNFRAQGASIYAVAIGRDFSEEAKKELDGYAYLNDRQINETGGAALDVCFGI